MKSKIIIATILCPTCYYIGHFASLLLHRFDSYFLACIYQNFMGYSVELEDWCGKYIMWEKVEEESRD